MKMVMIWQKDSKIFVEEGNETYGPNLEIDQSIDSEPLHRIWIERIDDGQEWRTEYELDVKNKVWIEYHKTGENYEKTYSIKFAHKDVLERGFSPTELSFLNAYLDRFLLIKVFDNAIRIPGDTSNIFIWDNETKTKYPVKYMGSLEDFKLELERLNLIQKTESAKMEKWSKLFLEHEEEIKEALAEMLRIAYRNLFGVIWLILDEEGKLETWASPSKDLTNEDVEAGRAVYITSFDTQYYEVDNGLYAMDIDDAKKIFTECGYGEYFEKRVKELGGEETLDRTDLYGRLPSEIYRRVFDRIVQNNIDTYFEKSYPLLRDYWVNGKGRKEKEKEMV